MSRTLIVRDHGRVRRIVADEYRVAIRPAAVGFKALLHWSRGNEGDFLRQELVRQAAPRRDVVNNPDAAAVRGQNEIVLARLNREVAHCYCRKMIAFELRPGFAAVDRNPKSELRPEEK